MNRRITFAVAALLLSAAAGPSNAQGIGYAQALDRLAVSCGKDIDRLCKKATLGGGRVTQCLDQNQGAVSANCKASLADMAAVFGPREAAVCRELTKLYETVTRGTLDRLAVDPAFAEPKGELVVLQVLGLEHVLEADGGRRPDRRPADVGVQVGGGDATVDGPGQQRPGEGGLARVHRPQQQHRARVVEHLLDQARVAVGHGRILASR